jgi:quinol monooxygenase YgiN
MDERIVRIAELEIVPTLLSEYLALLREEIAASLEREEGVLMLHAVSEQAAPNRIRLLEVYVSRAAYEAHITTPHFLKYKQGTLHMVTSLRLIDVDPVLFAAR